MSRNSFLLRITLLVLAAAAMPVLAVAFSFSQRAVNLTSGSSAGLLATSLLVSVLLAAAGAKLLVVEPLVALGRAMADWHEGRTFEVRPTVPMPSELAELVDLIRGATVTLHQRERDLQEAVARQDLLMQEIHHRVKNNLQIIASLMNLQASRIKLPEAQAEFQSARDRVRALATVHRHLYAHGELHSINMREFLVELCEQLFQAMGETPGERIALEISAPELQISSDQAVPLSLIVTEAVSNAVKYAFPRGRRGSISVRLATDGDDAELSIRDDGIGVPAGRVETESGTRDGIGITLIRGFARQLGATLTVEEDGGTRYVVRMKLRRERIESPPLSPAA